MTKATEGQEFDDLDDARAHAIEAARDIMVAEVREGRLCMSCYIEIADYDEKPLMTLDFAEALEVRGV